MISSDPWEEYEQRALTPTEQRGSLLAQERGPKGCSKIGQRQGRGQSVCRIWGRRKKGRLQIMSRHIGVEIKEIKLVLNSQPLQGY